MSHAPSPESPAPHHGGHEKRDITTRPIVLGGVLIVALTAVSFVLVKSVYTTLSRQAVGRSAEANPLAANYGRQEPPEPRLQNEPLGDLAKLRQAEAATLSSFAWIDKSAGTVRLPIERAIDLVAERGLAARRSNEAGQ